MTQPLFRESHVMPTLRYYQEECLRSLLDGIKQGEHSQLAVLATGLGKSVIFAALAREIPGNILFCAHRDELIGQAQRHIEMATGEVVELEQAGWESYKGRLVVGSVQSLCKQRRLDRLGKDRFDLVVIDEAHHGVMPTYRRVIDFFDCPVIGFTATPNRADEMALGKVFSRVAYLMEIVDGIEQGWLVPFDGRRVVLEQIDLSGVKKSAGDLASFELDEMMVKSAKGIVAESLKLAPDRQAICFMPGVKSAELAMHEYNTYRSDMACMIHGKTDPEERKQIVADFRRERYQVLTNCQIATEGFDVPEVSCIVMGRPTLSMPLYVQMMGRGGRPLGRLMDALPGASQALERRRAIAASAKPDCMLIDCVGNAERHDVIRVEDALGGNFDAETVEKAKKKTARQGGDPLRALKEAQAEIKAMMAQQKAVVKARVTRFDPFAMLGVEHTEEDRYAQRFGLKPATDLQRKVLLQKGMTEPEMDGLSRRAASQLLDEMSRRQRQELATFKQVRALEKYGVPNVRNATFQRASAGLSYLADQGWNRHAIDPNQLWTIVHGQRDSGED